MSVMCVTQFIHEDYQHDLKAKILKIQLKKLLKPDCVNVIIYLSVIKEKNHARLENIGK